MKWLPGKNKTTEIQLWDMNMNIKIDTFNKKLLDFANHINRTKTGSKRGIKPGDPEYRILEPVVTEEMAEVGLCLKLREPRSADEVARLCGKHVERVSELLWQLSVDGVCFVNNIDGVDRYWLETWIPGVMEMMANNIENVKKHPQIAEAFEAYGRVRGPLSAGVFPIGMGLMRVIPIEQSIMAETRRASYEEVSKFLNDNEIFSVSDCACRTAREAMGEGCGHLKEDMCIQMGHAAEYYIRTGRGRQITRDEAFEVIRKAEENGLMHQIPNTEGPEHTHAICNCCGCSCLSLRTAGMFYNNDMVRSNYVSEVKTDNCVACGECVEVCPVNAVKLGQKICSTKPVEIKRHETPRSREWGEDKWNPDYRINKQVVLETGSSPCKAECPAHIAVQGYIKLAAQGRYTEALELIKHENPFPAVCGRICPRKCESACTRGEIDSPVAIDEIKKFIAEQDIKNETRFIPKKRHNYGNRIAVIGAGPAGLSCAFYLAVDGYNVTVFEKQRVLGGMLTMGIPAFRLEKNVINAEIDILKELGVEFKTGVEVGRDLSISDLRRQGYEAFYVAIGAQGGKKLGIEGEDADGVITGVDFLRSVSLGEHKPLEGRVIIIGGGNVAIDVARTALRVGSTRTDIFCLEKRNEMPALEEEIDEAAAEGIVINNSWAPKRIITENGRLTGVEFKRCISVYDTDRRFSPAFDENDTITVRADYLLLSVGQSIEWGNLVSGTEIELNSNQTIQADPVTFQTGEPDVFAGGDSLTGPRFAIDAIAQGKEGAISIHRYVHPGQSLTLGRIKRDYLSFDKDDLALDGYDRMPRQSLHHIDGNESKKTFRDLRETFTEEQVRKETERCLGCGAAVVDSYLCVGCGACTLKCKFDAISLKKKYDCKGVDLLELRPIVMKNAIKRQFRIIAKKPFRLIDSAFPKKPDSRMK